MKKLSKVLLFIAIVLCISLPLSAAKMMNVTWQWLLNDPYVTSYRYQIDGENEDGWTVVSADTDKYVAVGLDPYKDYTLYLQCTYDGNVWSESAKSTAYALLEYVEVPAVVEEPVVVEEAPVEVAPIISGSAEFDVFGFVVNNSWNDGEFTAQTAINGILTENDVRGFALYEIEKYGSFLTDNVSVEFIADGLKLSFPKDIDPFQYISVFKSDIEEYVSTLFAPVEEVEEPVKEEEKVEEPVVPETADFTVFGYKVLNSWVPGTFTSVSETRGLLSESDVKGFVEYEIGKYGDFLLENVAIEYVADGFVLTYPEVVDPAAYISQYKSDIEEYVSTLFAPVEEVEEPVKEEVKVEETVVEVVPVASDFTVFGYKVLNSWIPGTFTSVSETKGLLSESDVKGFAEYEIGKYGDFLLENVAIKYVADGFVLTYPEAVNPSAYISQYKNDIEEYVSTLFAPEEEVEEPVKEEVKVEETVVEEPTAPSAPSEPVAVDVPKPAEVVEVVVSPKAEKLSSYKFKLGFGFGPEFGINNKVEYVTIFPRLSITADFQNVFTVSKFGFGARIDLTGVFKPLDGTFIGHEFKFFLNGNNWAVDAMIDAKLMAYANFDKVQLYVGGGIGYSIGSHSLYKYTHTSDVMIFGFDTAAALSAVVGLDWNINDKLTLTLEGNYRYFFQSSSKAQTFAATVGMGFMF